MNPARAILLKLASVSAFVAMASLVKATEGRVPPGEVVFFRSFFALPVILAWLWATGELAKGWRTSNPGGHLLRGLFGTSAMGLKFAGLLLLPLPEATALFYAAPILTVIFAALLLGEKVRAFRLTAVVFGLAGVLVVLAPRLTAFSQGTVAPPQALGAILVLLAATFAALAQICVRKLVGTERAATVVLYFTLTSLTLSLLTIPFGWVLPSARDAALLIVTGLMGGAGQGFLTSAYRFAPASFVAPFDYASMLLAVAVGFFVFHEIPTLPTLGGAALIIVAGLLIVWREGRSGSKATA